jgi:hypothetical protein
MYISAFKRADPSSLDLDKYYKLNSPVYCQVNISDILPYFACAIWLWCEKANALVSIPTWDIFLVIAA